MNKVFCLLLLTVLSATVYGAANRFDPRPQMKRYCKLDNSRKQLLFANGKVNFEIVSGPSMFARMAADDMAALLSRSLGVKIPVLKKKSGKKTALIIGDPAAARRAGFDPAKMEWGGFRIKSFKGDIIMAGFDNGSSSMGSAFAVYDFLERFAGMRFYFPGSIGTIVPKMKKWSVPVIDISDRPDMQHRVMYSVDPFSPGGKIRWYEKASHNEGYALAVRRMRLQHNTPLQSCHGLAHLGLPERFGKSNPEFFALGDHGNRMVGGPNQPWHHQGGQLCLSSKKLEHEIYLDAKAHLSGKSAKSRNAILKNGRPAWPSAIHAPGFFNIMPNDSFSPCRCSKCKVHYSGLAWNKSDTQKSSDYIWGFKTRIARKLQQEKIPGYMLTMAYSPYRTVPNVKIPSNMLVMVGLTGPWAEGTPFQKEHDRQLKEWNRKLGARPYIWTYVTKISAKVPLIPNTTPRTIGKYFKRVSPWIFGAFLEAESDQWIFGYLNFFIFGKVMWNSKADVDALLKEHHQKMFGAAAAEMGEFFDSLERQWMKNIVGKTVDTPAGPVAVKPSDFMLWREIFTPAEIARLKGLLEKAIAKTAKDPDSRKRVEFIRKQFFLPICQGAEKYNKTTVAVSGWTGVMPELAPGEKIIIDGKGTDKAWAKAKSYFLLPNPEVKSESVEVRTSFKALRDKNNFYFLVNCEEPLTSKMTSIRRPFDNTNIWQDNEVELFFDPEGSRKGGYQLLFNSSGSMSDNSFNPALNWKWNSGAKWKVNITKDKCWTLEVMIPRKNMKPCKDRLVFNLLRSRVISGQNFPFQTWNPQVRRGHDVERFGTLLFKAEKKTSLIHGGDFTEKQYGNRLGKKGIYWRSASPEKLIQDTKVFRTGGVSLRFDENCEGAVYHDITDLKPGTRYRMSYYIKLDNIKSLYQWGGGVYVSLDCGILPRQVIFFPPKSKYVGTMPWTYQCFEFTTPKNLRQNNKRCYLHISRFKKYTRGTAWIDQMELYEIPDKKR